MRISDWSSDVCSSDLKNGPADEAQHEGSTQGAESGRNHPARRNLDDGGPGYASEAGGRHARTEYASHHRMRGVNRGAQISGQIDRKRVEYGKRVSVRVESAGHRILKKKKTRTK